MRTPKFHRMAKHPLCFRLVRWAKTFTWLFAVTELVVIAGQPQSQADLPKKGAGTALGSPLPNIEFGIRSLELTRGLLSSVVTGTQLAADSPNPQETTGPNPAVRNPGARPSLTWSSGGAHRLSRKLDEIILPEVHFDGVPLAEVVKRLSEDAKKFDPEEKGLNFLINDV